MKNRNKTILMIYLITLNSFILCTLTANVNANQEIGVKEGEKYE